MTLSEADLVAAGNAALRLLDLPENAQVDLPAGTELDRSWDGWVHVTTALPGDEVLAGNGMLLDGTRAGAAESVLDGLTNDLSETSAFYAVAFPRCPGHPHPADYGHTGDDLWLRCPQTGVEFRRVAV